MKRKAKDGNVNEPLPEYADVLTLAQREKISFLWDQADAMLTAKERIRERELMNRLGPDSELTQEEQQELTGIRRKAAPGRHWAVLRMEWMCYANTEHWRRTKQLAVWRLSHACWWIDGHLLGKLQPAIEFAHSHHFESTFAVSREAWDYAVAKITTGDLWAVANSTARVQQEYAVGNGWNYRTHTVPDYDVRPAEFLKLIRDMGIYLVPELEALLPDTIDLRQSKLANAKRYVQQWRTRWHAEHGGRIGDCLAAFKLDQPAIIGLRDELGNVDTPKDSTLRTWIREGADATMSRRGALPGQ